MKIKMLSNIHIYLQVQIRKHKVLPDSRLFYLCCIAGGEFQCIIQPSLPRMKSSKQPAILSYHILELHCTGPLNYYTLYKGLYPKDAIQAMECAVVLEGMALRLHKEFWQCYTVSA